MAQFSQMYCTIVMPIRIMEANLLVLHDELNQGYIVTAITLRFLPSTELGLVSVQVEFMSQFARQIMYTIPVQLMLRYARMAEDFCLIDDYPSKSTWIVHKIIPKLTQVYEKSLSVQWIFYIFECPIRELFLYFPSTPSLSSGWDATTQVLSLLSEFAMGGRSVHQYVFCLLVTEVLECPLDNFFLVRHVPLVASKQSRWLGRHGHLEVCHAPGVPEVHM